MTLGRERAWEEKDGNLHDWCRVAPGSEARMKAAIEAVLRKPAFTSAITFPFPSRAGK